MSELTSLKSEVMFWRFRCDNALSKYSCPKCHVKYCSLTCYQSEKHLQCSEEFYKKCIIEELALENNEEAKKKMLEILKRNHLNDEEDSELDSDDEDDVADITNRLAGVDLDNADQVWEKLTEDEQQEFIAFLKFVCWNCGNPWVSIRWQRTNSYCN